MFRFVRPQVTAATPVRIAWLAVAAGLAIGLAGCDPAVADMSLPPSPASAAATAAVTPQFCTGTSDFCVSETGLDTNVGSNAAPFRTITRALSAASSGNIVQVLPGTYTSGSGETFPLSLPGNVTLLGDEANKGNGTPPTTIAGSALVSGVTDSSQGTPTESTFMPGTGSVIAGFNVIGVGTVGGHSGNLVLIQDPITGVTLRNNTLSGANTSGILEQDSGGNTFSGNVVSGNGFSGFTSDCTSTGTPACSAGASSGDSFDNNVFANNVGQGVSLLNSGGGGNYDFGGGGISVGNNVFCGSSIGLIVNISPGATINASNNAWPFHDPAIVVTSIAAGSDFVNNNGNSAVTISSSLPVPSTCP